MCYAAGMSVAGVTDWGKGPMRLYGGKAASRTGYMRLDYGAIWWQGGQPYRLYAPGFYELRLS